MKKTYLLSIILFSVSMLGIYAQQDAQYTQYMYNTISVNPAYAGSRNAISITGLYRNQWIGIDGAPVTQTLNIHSPIGASEKVGLGLSLVNDKIGPTQETYIDIDFSYTINTSDDGKLSFGVKAGGHLLDVDFNRLNQYATSDILLDTNIDNKFSPNVGIGAYYYTSKFYAGISAPNLLKTKHFNESSNDNTASSFLAVERINYYMILGYVFDINEYLKLKPAVLSKVVSGSPLQVDVSANFLLYDKLTLGLAYRWSAALSGLVGFQVSDSMMLGFAYDWETTALGNTEFNSGSYEFFLRYEIFKKKERVLYPRFF
ncbi:PorP/SprF family type IX secretion system membrane protein [Aquimarina sp. 2201CG14-23]|uniref:PorP/SprF family type IX secretion system membrane protein n=1 Tax=Aquimarina mycalae TaxID=3040073 RepID=UPI002478287E|nr:type IX secretion system membrane protein PorP/SprF [Aquimarina sp. 2201CG14-23]MDH7447835.1 type IX secretion system membrane protein PorP/SprF [Aquimarina sp. 2201CG14-23]